MSCDMEIEFNPVRRDRFVTDAIKQASVIPTLR
jgi:hypothetical protein